MTVKDILLDPTLSTQQTHQQLAESVPGYKASISLSPKRAIDNARCILKAFETENHPVLGERS